MGEMRVNAKGYKVFRGEGHVNVLKLIMVKVSQLCEYTKIY